MKRIGIIGYGNMGSALARGIRSRMNGTVIRIVEPSAAQREAAEKECGALAVANAAELLSDSDIVILAVKPQYLASVLAELKAALPGCKGNPLFISIAAGRTIAGIQEALGSLQVVRFMPNIAASAGAALTGVAFPAGIGDTHRADAFQVAQAAGEALELPESLMSAFTGLCGSGIAYVLQMLHAMALGGTKCGMPYATSLKVALGTLHGAVALVKESGEHPVSLLSKVVSPAGTTIEGIQALEEGAFNATVMDAVERAAVRAADFES